MVDDELSETTGSPESERSERSAPHSKPRLTVILGAGHSQGLGIPGTRAITEAVENALSQTQYWEAIAPMRARLIEAYQGNYNFETLAAALETCECIVGSMPSQMTPGRLLEYGSVLPDVAVLRDQLESKSILDIYGIILDKVRETVDVKWWETIEAEKMESAREVYDRLRSVYNLDVITLNYDLSCERFLSAAQDGFGEGRFSSTLFWNNGDFDKLAHLHGSLQFSLDEDHGLRKAFPSSQKEIWTVRSDGVFFSSILTGEGKAEKITFPPYSIYYAWLAQCLMRSPRVVLIGYGASDAYLNAWLMAASRHHGADFRVVIVDDFAHRYGPPVRAAALAAFARGSTWVDQDAILCDYGDGYRRDTVWLLGDGFPLSHWRVDQIIRFLGTIDVTRGSDSETDWETEEDDESLLGTLETDIPAFESLLQNHGSGIRSALIRGHSLRGLVFSYPTDGGTDDEPEWIEVSIRPEVEKVAFSIRLHGKSGRFTGSRLYFVPKKIAMRIIRESLGRTEAAKVWEMYKDFMESVKPENRKSLKQKYQ